MRILLLSVFAIVALPSSTGCTLFETRGDLDEASVDRLDKNIDLIAPPYRAYAAAAGSGPAAVVEVQEAKAVLKAAKADLDASRLAEITAKLEAIFPKYLVFVRGDATMSDSDKETEEDLVAASRRLIDSMRRRLED